MPCQHLEAHKLLGVFAMMAFLAAPVPVQAASCPDIGADSPAARAREWILVGWEKRPGDPAFDFQRQLGRFYDQDVAPADASFYDDFDPQHRLLNRAADYGAIWQAPFTALRAAEHRISQAPKVLRDGRLAVSTLQFVARLTAADGAAVGNRTLSTLTWRCSAGGWKIVREHNSSQRIAGDALDAAMAGASAER